MSNEIDFAARKAQLEAELANSAETERQKITGYPTSVADTYDNYAQQRRETPVFKSRRRSEKSLLNTAGGIMVVLALIDIIFAVVTFLFGSMSASRLDRMTGGSTDFELRYMINWLFAFVGTVLMLIVGVLGVLNSDNPKGAKKCLVIGLILFIPAIYNLIVAIGGGYRLEILFSVVATLLPGAYTIGAYQVMRED